MHSPSDSVGSIGMSKSWLVGQHRWHDSMEVECEGDPRVGAGRCYKSQVGVAMQLETRCREENHVALMRSYCA